MPTSVLYCSDPLNPRRVDEHFAAEARAVREGGGVVALIDHDALSRGEADRAVERVASGFGAAWYRGWMVPADEYAALARALERRGANLMIGPGRYRAAHELPGWYSSFAAVTPASAWRPWSAGADGEPPEDRVLTSLAAELRPGPGIVKDYVKSRKHEWDEACFIPDLSDAAAVARIVRRFVELQGEFLAGGIVLREFEPFVNPRSASRPSGTSQPDTTEPVAAELRVWWLDGSPRLVTPHPDSAYRGVVSPELDRVEPAVRALGCRFVTTDLALRSDGAWRVVEVGDGQVSDLHPAIDPAELIGLLPAE
jgi:ATP-grasp domain, R2K clade family 3